MAGNGCAFRHGIVCVCRFSPLHYEFDFIKKACYGFRPQHNGEWAVVWLHMGGGTAAESLAQYIDG